MKTIRDTQKKYCSRALTFAILTAVIFIVADQKDIGKGLILGTIFSIINFILMGEALPARLGKAKSKTLLFSLGGIVVRFALLAVPLVVGIKNSGIDLIAVVFGLFMVQLVLLADHIAGSIASKFRKST